MAPDHRNRRVTKRENQAERGKSSMTAHGIPRRPRSRTTPSALKSLPRTTTPGRAVVPRAATSRCRLRPAGSPAPRPDAPQDPPARVRRDLPRGHPGAGDEVAERPEAETGRAADKMQARHG